METTNKWEQYPCLHSKVVQILYDQGFSNPTPVQSEVFENYKHYFDFLIASQTGSGKTLSFAAPIVSELYHIQQQVPLPPKPLCLILTPTRQLAVQIQQTFKYLLVQTQIEQTCILGGISIEKQVRILQKKCPQIIIGTPGRIHELLQQNQLSFEMLKFLVIDEADRMIEMGHYKELDDILYKIFIPKVKQTFEKDFQEINKKLDQAERANQAGQFFILEKGKKKKINFNLNSLKADTLIEVPFQFLSVQGLLPPTINNNLPKSKAKAKSKKQNTKTQNSEPQELQQNNKNEVEEQHQGRTLQLTLQTSQFINKMKRKVFFISATLTREFKGTKYYTKKHKLDQIECENDDKDKKNKGKKKKEDQNQYIPKLKALLSHIKFDLKPKIIDKSTEIFLPKKLKEQFRFCESDIDKVAVILSYLSELEDKSKVIIFTNTIRALKRVKFFLELAGHKLLSLHSHMIQKRRLQKLQKFQGTKFNILLSTDVAARGLDFHITHVIQYSVPLNGDTYVHRIGRTARANKSGQALILINDKQSTKWQQINQILQSSDSTRKIHKYFPTQSNYRTKKQKVEHLQWIRLNSEKQENKRIQKLNEVQAEQFGLQAQQNRTKQKQKSVSKYKQDNQLEQQNKIKRNIVQKQIQRIKKENSSLDTKNKAAGYQNNVNNSKKINLNEIGDGKIWKKNKLVMSLEQIKKFL